MRDHKKLNAFKLADTFVLNVYQTTNAFPKEEVFGLTSQIRRAAVSIPSNIVEGSARFSEPEYLRFLEIAYGSAKEVEYQLSLARRLEYLPHQKAIAIETEASGVARILNALITGIRNPKPKA